MTLKKSTFPYLGTIENFIKSYPSVLFSEKELNAQELTQADADISLLIPNDVKLELFDLLTKYYIPALSEYAIKTNFSLKRLEQYQHEYFVSKGDLSEYQLKKHSKASSIVSNVMCSLISLSELFLNVSCPILEDENSQMTTRLDTGQIVLLPATQTSLGSEKIDTIISSNPFSPFGSEQEFKFYKQIPDLKFQVSIAYLSNLSSSKSGVSTPPLSLLDADYSRFDELIDKPESFNESILLSEVAFPATLDDTLPIGSHSYAQYLSFFERLSRISSAEEADKLSIEFCYINSKSSRRRLIQEIMESCKKAPDSLSYFCRILIRLYPYAPGIVDSSLLPMVESEFKALRRQTLLIVQGTSPATRRHLLGALMGLLRLISELCKFSLASLSLPIACLRILLAEDFSGPSDLRLSASCAFLENIGQFLHRQAETHDHLMQLVDIVEGYKKKLPKDHPLVPLIESAVFQTLPPELRPPIPVSLPENPMTLFFRHLFATCFLASNRRPLAIVEFVTEKLRKCDWSEPEVSI